MGAIRAFRVASVLGACFGLLTSTADATSITVNNFSFESPAVPPPGNYTTSCPTGWTCSSGFGGGVFYPTNTQYPAGDNGLTGGALVPDGNQEAWVQGNLPQYLMQNTSVSIAANTTYTLSVWAGARNDQQPDAWAQGFQPTIELSANGEVVASLVTTDPGNGMWEDFSLSWASVAADVGDTLGLELLYPGSVDSQTQVGWDDVTLNSSLAATPIPGAFPLFAGGLGMGALFARRKKRKTSAA